MSLSQKAGTLEIHILFKSCDPHFIENEQMKYWNLRNCIVMGKYMFVLDLLSETLFILYTPFQLFWKQGCKKKKGLTSVLYNLL